MLKIESEWKEIQCTGTVPPPSFGHTATMVGKNRVVLFGGAIEQDHKYVMTDAVYVYSIYKREWTKLAGIVGGLRRVSWEERSVSAGGPCGYRGGTAKTRGLWRSRWQYRPSIIRM